jgi:hypothetical protein
MGGPGDAFLPGVLRNAVFAVFNEPLTCEFALKDD